jgi:alkylation response protein AidB-like acyl-CoA dehydrogenase
MIDFGLSDEERMVRDSIRAFIEREVMPLERILLDRAAKGLPEGLQKDEQGDLQQKARAAGFWGIDTPEMYGGVDFNPVLQLIVWHEAGRTFVPFRFGGSAMNIMYGVSDDLKREYLIPTIGGNRKGCFAVSEPGMGSDARGLKMSATRDGDEWVLNGEKTWITGGSTADYVVVLARTAAANESRGDGTTAFVVDRSRGWTSTTIPVMGAHDAASLVFDNVRVPSRYVIGEIHRGFSVAMNFIYKNRAIYLGGMLAGAAERMIEMALHYSQARITFGEPIADRENIQIMIAESEVELRAAKLLALNAAWQMKQGLDYRHAACATKFHAARIANRVADRAMQIHGAMGYSKALPIERWYRDLRVTRIWEGTDEINAIWMFRSLREGRVTVGQLS